MLKSETFYLCKQLQSLKGNGVQVMVVLYCIVLVLVILINSEPFAKESGGFLIAWWYWLLNGKSLVWRNRNIIVEKLKSENGGKQEEKYTLKMLKMDKPFAMATHLNKVLHCAPTLFIVLDISWAKFVWVESFCCYYRWVDVVKLWSMIHHVYWS